MFFINFNNKNSFNDLGLKIPYRPNIPIPEESINSIPVEGRDGTLTKKLGYKDIEIPVVFTLINKNNINDSCRQVKAWLMNINKNFNENKLVFSDDLDYFYKVKYIKFNKEIERILKVFGRFTAIFVCDPFSYLQDGLNTITITQPTTINNGGTYQSEPIIKVYGQGDITLTINNKNIILYGIQDYISIDSVKKDAYKNTLKQNNKMYGKFPLLSDVNIISWVGNVTKIEIQPNSRCL